MESRLRARSEVVLLQLVSISFRLVRGFLLAYGVPFFLRSLRYTFLNPYENPPFVDNNFFYSTCNSTCRGGLSVFSF